MQLLVATRNRHKLQEILCIFKYENLDLIAADDLEGLPADVEEDADTFEGNALKKARVLCDASGLWTMIQCIEWRPRRLLRPIRRRGLRLPCQQSETSARTDGSDKTHGTLSLCDGLVCTGRT